MISCIYLDLDGVIFDFDGRFEKLYGMTSEQAEHKKMFDTYFRHFIETRQFETLDLMPGATDGLTFLRKASVPTQILSSTSNMSRHESISKQKMISLHTHGITFNPILVPGAKHKKEYGGENKILIDDTAWNCSDWLDVGGFAIPHHDWKTTIHILTKHGVT